MEGEASTPRSTQAEADRRHAVSDAFSEPADLTLVVAAGCSLCDHARRVLRSVGRDVAIRVTQISLESAEGQELAQRVPLMFPPILLEGESVLSYGRVSEKRLRRILADGR